jgi:hypothetical protein
MKKKIILLLLCCFVFNSALSAESSNSGTTAFQFLNICIGARQAAMGEAFCAAGKDVNTIYFNPSGLAESDMPEINFSNNQWFGGAKHQALSFSYPVEDYGVFGFGFVVLNTEEISGYDIDSNGDPVKTADFRASDNALVLSYAKEISKTEFGVNIKILQEKIETTNASSFCIDAGVTKKLTKHINIGVCVQNLGMPAKFINNDAPLPVNLKAGIAVYLLKDKLLLTSDANKPVDNKMKINSGFEYNAYKNFIVRGGYLPEKDLGSNLTMGAGYHLNDLITIDYAFVPYGELGTSNRISISLKFDSISDIVQ